MANVVKFSIANPVQFYWTDRVFRLGKNQYFQGEDWFLNQLPAWMKRVPYLQKWQKSDEIYLQLQNNFGTASWQIIDCSGTELLAGDFAIINEIPPGQIYYYYDTTIQLAAAEIPVGVQFYIVVTVGIGEFTAQWISEPQIVQVSLQKTGLFAYTAPKGEYFDMWFNEERTIYFRAEARVGDYVPGSSSKIFYDLQQNVAQLSSTPFDRYSLKVEWVADWVAKKINNIVSFPAWSFEDMEFTRAEEGSALEPTRDQSFPLSSWKIDVRPATNAMYDLSDSEFNRRSAVVYNIPAKVFGTINNTLPSDTNTQIIDIE